MKRWDRKAYESHLRELGNRSLATHVIRKAYESGDRWIVGTGNGSSCYRAEIIVTYDRSVIVHGDVDIVCFQSYHGSPGARSVVAWLASATGSYLMEKATIGTGREVAHSWDAEVALDDAMWHLEQAQKDSLIGTPEANEPDFEVDEYAKRDIDLWTRVVVRLEHGEGEQGINQFIYDESGDSELTGIGDVISPRVVWAHMLVQKLQELLEAQEKEPNE